MRFTKMHGAGNDFVVLDLRGGRTPPSPDLCRRLADRHIGVGCDQILTIEDVAAATANARYGIWNADGSRAQQCGNGARCVAAWLQRDASARNESLPESVELESPAGRHPVEFRDGGLIGLDMGCPRFDPAALPLVGLTQDEEYHLDVDGRDVRFGAVSMGNPHAVIEVDDVDAAPVAQLGAAMQRHAAFPESVNVGFVQVIDRGHIRLRVFERGVGETLACGSGACAAAAVLMRRGRFDRDVVVALPGGELRIDWPTNDAPLRMAGPAAFVFEGDWLDE